MGRREIKLKWETATEVNSSLFLVERKLYTESNWTTIGEVKAAGSSTTLKITRSMTKN